MVFPGDNSRLPSVYCAPFVSLSTLQYSQQLGRSQQLLSAAWNFLARYILPHQTVSREFHCGRLSPLTSAAKAMGVQMSRNFAAFCGNNGLRCVPFPFQRRSAQMRIQCGSPKSPIANLPTGFYMRLNPFSAELSKALIGERYPSRIGRLYSWKPSPKTLWVSCPAIPVFAVTP